MKKVLVVILFFFLPLIGYAQIVIEERVEILPEGISNILPSGSISGDDRNPVYLGYGGEVTLSLIHRTHNSYQLWEETLGQLTISGTISIGTFPQWHKFIFYLLDPATGNKYYPQPGDNIVWEWGSTIDFYPSLQPGDPYPYNPEDWWEINIDVDYSLAAMPPQEILDYLGNPFAQSEPLEVPVAGSLYAVVYSYTNADDALWIDLPGTQLIQDDLINHDGEIFELGNMTAGEEIRFFITSSNTIVNGSNLYPSSGVIEEPTPEGDIHLWTLYFEDWTDLFFDDVEVEIYIRPEEPYPGNIAAIIEPEELAPGDTATITFKRRYLNGMLEDFPEWRMFEIGMVDGCDLGNLLVNGETGTYFNYVVQPVNFVADSSAETGTVKLEVGLVEGIGTRPIQNDPSYETDKQIKAENPKQKGNLKEVISARRENRTKPVVENKKVYENVTPSNPENSSCPLLEFNNPVVSNFDLNVVGDECANYTCSEVILKPSFTYESFTNGTFNEDPCNDEQNKDTSKTVSGVFSVLWGRTAVTAIAYFKTENLSACYDPIFSKWKFGTTLPLYPYFQSILDVCLTNITNKGYKYLYDISEIQSVWNNPDICEAKKDLEGHKSYPSKVRTGGYIFLEVEMAHEMAHGQDFQWVIDSLQNGFLYPTLDLLEVTCGNYDEENKKANNEHDAKLIYFNYLQKVVAGEKKNGQIIYKGFEDLLFEGYESHINQSFIVDEKQVDHENYINSRPVVTSTINVLLSEFENIWNCN